MKKPSTLAIAALAAICTACQGPPSRPERAQNELFAARDAENAGRSADFNVLMGGFVQRARDKVTMTKAGTAKPPTIDLLVVSGGGDWGAFGAGVLKGWGRVKGGRPQFDVVTGVSTGALIAPFAFLGDDASIERVLQLYRAPDKDIA